MLRRTIAGLGLAIALAGSAWGQEAQPATAGPTNAQPAASQPASQPATVQVDAATLEALKQRLRDQERRLQQLEAAKDNGEQVRREEIVQVLKEMNLAADKKADDMRVFWKDGLRMETADGNFKMRVGGRMHLDAGWAQESDKLAKAVNNSSTNDDFKDGVEIRRARILLAGEIYKDIEFVTEYDFAGDAVHIKDMYLGMKNIPVIGNIRVGNFKEPFMLDELTSDNYITFIERALPDVFAPSYKMGIMAYDAILKDSKKTERATWAVGMFRDTTDGNVSSDGGYNLTGRLTGLPWYEDKGNRLLHVGAAYSFRTPNDGNTLRYATTPEEHIFSQKFVDTGNMLVDHTNLFGGEVATVVGPWHAESEYVASYVDSQTQGTMCFGGFYAQTGYFLTGETRPYKTNSGTFDRVRPKKNFRENGGWGAWEVAARYSYLDLGDKNLTAASSGELQDVTIGLNWYLNPNVRVMWNYIHAMADREDVNGDADIFLMRFQIDF